MPGTQCKGCHGCFSDGGYLRHITTTANPKCQKEYNTEYIPPPTSNLFERLYGHKPVIPNQNRGYEEEGLDFGDAMDISCNILPSNFELGGDNSILGGNHDGLCDHDNLFEADDSEDNELETAADTAAMEGRLQEPEVPEHLKAFEISVNIRPTSPSNLLDDNVNRCESSRSPSPCAMLSDSEANEDMVPEFSNPRQAAKASLSDQPVIEPYPDPMAGTPLPNQHPVSGNMRYAQKLEGIKCVDGHDIWAPFSSEMDWRIAQWAKIHRPSSTALTELLSIPNLVETLKLSFKSANELNKIIDESLPSRPEFKIDTVVVHDEAFEVYYRDILSCVEALFSEPDFAPYTNLRNIPKEIRCKPSSRAYMLVGYLPTLKLKHITNKAARRRALLNVFHTCMRHIVKPLEEAGANGLNLASGDGLVWRTHPLLAIYACDYPKQITVTCACYSDCAECQIIEEMMGEGTSLYPVRDLVKVLHALSTLDEDGPAAFKKGCKDAGVKAVFDAFWRNLPYSNIFRFITPDILHQLYQGVIKHLKNWVITAYGAAEIDARCRCLPPNHHVWLFVNGISLLSCLTGQEHNDIARFLLSIIVDIPLPGGFSSVHIVCCVWALIDFLYIAQYPAHTNETLNLLADALTCFHQNKDIFIDLDVRPHFRLPKLHFLNHYIWKIKHFGSLDNSNTEYTEHLHIDMTKDAYPASNQKDEYVQMTKWLGRKEKILKHQNFIAWRVAGCPPIQRFDHWLPSTLVRSPRTLELPK
ncbi:hypothetical protein AAF712_015393 [Marasmius tenuissimus]|uniref:Transposase n=1 Tax=Marasmius tenuissimus TaxID=585030 RepID=A0ABR2Z9G1_9AGAR